MINYLEHDQYGITIVRCMKCAAVVGKREFRAARFILVHMSHSRKYRVELDDGSVADTIVCVDCLPTMTETDHSDLQDAMRWGWQRELEWKFNESANPLDRKAYDGFKKHFGIKGNEEKIPPHVLNKIFAGKAIKGKK